MAWGAKYRWPLLISVPVLGCGGIGSCGWCRRALPASNPGDFSSERVAEIDHRGVQLLLRDGGPQFQLVALAVALVAVVAAGRHVDREVPGTVGGGIMQGTASVPLLARSSGMARSRASVRTCSIVISRRSLSKSIPGMAFLGACRVCGVRQRRFGPFRSLFLYRGNGNDPAWRQSTRCQPAGV